MWNNFISFNLSLLGQRAPHQQPAVSGMKNDIRYEIFSLLTIRWWHLLYFCCCIPSHDKIQSQSSQNSLLNRVYSWVMFCCCRCQVWKRSWSLNVCVSLNSIFCNYYCMTQVQTKPGFEIFIYQPRANCLRWFMENISNLNKNWDSRHFLNPPLVLANCSQVSRVLSVSAFQYLTWKPPTINNRPHQMWHQIPEQKKYQVAFLHGK